MPSLQKLAVSRNQERDRFELKFDNELISAPTAASHTEQAFQLSMTNPGLWEWD